MSDIRQSRPHFHSMEESTANDWQYMIGQMRPLAESIPDRVIAHLQLLKEGCDGWPINRFDHSLQAATRAHRDDRDEEYVVMALLHDIGDTLGIYNHADVAAAILQPFLSDENHWIVQRHNIFQGFYYFHHLGLDRDMRERFRGHPAFEATAEFVDKYDMAAFDPSYDSAPLSFFEPMVRRVMARPKQALIM